MLSSAKDWTSGGTGHIHSGDTYDEETENALHSAGVVVVLWSPSSVASRWVRAEATVADQNKTFMPVMIAPCHRPVMFELTQTADLSHWRGTAEDPAWQAFVGDVRRMLGREAGESGATEGGSAPQRQAGDEASTLARLRRHAPMLALLLLIAAAAAIYALSRRCDTASQSRAEAGKVSVAVLPFRNCPPTRTRNSSPTA